MKPGNILLTRDGLVKIIDFGLAKLGGVSRITKDNRRMGTAAYLSPEQARGEDVDQRTDVWSLGVVLYEMLAGRLPFGNGENAEATIQCVLEGNPRPVRKVCPDVPVQFERILDRALQKDPNLRYASAADILRDLTDYQSAEETPKKRLVEGGLASRWFRQLRVSVLALVILLVLGSMLAWSFYRPVKVWWAGERLLPKISRLVDEGQYEAGFILAQQAEEYIPNHPQLVKYWRILSKSVSIHTTPPGADVYMKEYDEIDGTWTFLGRSPLENVRIPTRLYRWKIEKVGFAAAEGVASGWYRPINFTLDPIENIPHGMVRVLGGFTPARLIVSGFENLEPVQLKDFWMDRYQVSNREFKRFVDAGGYQKRKYWKRPFLDEGRFVSWPDAMARFRDATGRPGPSTWEAGHYPKGQDDHPVSAV